MPFLVPNFANARKEVPPLHRVQFRTPRRAKNHSQECRHGQKNTAQSSSVPCDSVNTSPKHLPKISSVPPGSSSMPPQSTSTPPGSSSAPCASISTSAPPGNPATASVPPRNPATAPTSAPASLDTLCVTKCHYLSFGKCFDIIRSVPSEMTDRMK